MFIVNIKLSDNILRDGSSRSYEKVTLLNKRNLARLITQYRDIFFPIFQKARPSFFRVLQRMSKVFNVTSLKYGKYNITNEKINNNKRLIDRAR